MEQESGVIKSTGNGVAEYDPNVLGAGSEVDVGDVKLSYLGVLNAASDLVKEDKNKQGEIVDRETGEVFGYKDKGVDIVVLKSYKYWMHKDANDNYTGRTPAKTRDDFPWTGPNGEENIYTHAFLVLIKNQMDEQVELPYRITLSSSGLKTAQKLSKFLMTMARKGEASWNKSFHLSAKLFKNDKNTWWGFDISPSEDTSDDIRKNAYSWYNTVGDPNEVTKTEETITEPLQEDGQF